MTRFISFLLPFLFKAHLFCSLPVTHLYLAQEWINNEEDRLIDIESFMIGTLFPDIRYLGEISREKTHETGLSLENIKKSSSSFLAGMRLHAYIDEKREELVFDWNIYPLIKSVAQGYEGTLLKLIEDELLYDQYNNPLIFNYLNNILDEESAYGVSQKTIQKWHALLHSYLKQKPSQLLASLTEQKKGFFNIPFSVIAEWNQIFSSLSKHPRLIQYVKCLTQHFLEEFRHFQHPILSSVVGSDFF